MKQTDTICPVCGKPLYEHGRIIMCPNQHAWKLEGGKLVPFEIPPPELVEQLRNEAAG